ncbi:MAG: penicillin-binding protein 2, partial [Candidatus Cloacimonadota bacterium]
FIDEFSWQYEDEFDYERNSKVGKSGLEKKYEERLRGKIGYNILQVDAKGRNLGFFENSVADTVRNGEDLILTIDNDFQQYCRTLFKKGQKGALIVMDIKTGGILSYEGYPEFDPNIFTGKLSKEDWDILNNNPDKPMFDRCVMGTYPPGSVFKPVIGTMILRTGKIDPYKDKFNCSGGLQVGNRFFKCWLGSGHGNVNLHTALQYSCDTYFYEVIKDYDLEDIADYTESNFLTVASGVDISSEQPGFFPSDYSHDKSGRNTSLGDLINLSIGQGAILVTPLQMCAYYNALGNKGIWIQPHFLYESLSESDHARLFVPEEKRLPASEKDIVIINKSLYAVVNSEKGTGRRAKLKGIDVWGKSGSAENHSGDTHAWFCGFAGKNMKPEISFTVFVENGGGGGKTAAPIAKKLIEFYFDNK